MPILFTKESVMVTFADLVPTAESGRFDGINRAHTADEAARLRGSVPIRHTLAERGAARLWQSLNEAPYVNALGAMTGGQAVQMVRAGLQAIYLSGWQVAADANTAGAVYPDQSLYPANAGPELARRINRALQRQDQVEHAEGGATRDWFAPIVADAEAGFGGPLNCFEIMKAYIEAGAAGVHFEDQLASEKKCGHLGGKVLIPTMPHERNLNAARLAADVMGVPTLVMARTDAESARLITSDADERDHPFIDFEAGRTPEGFHRLKAGTGVDHCIARGLAFADKADLLWWETSKPNLDDARRFAEAIHREFPGKMLSYNCSPSFNWKKNLDNATIARFQRELGALGYKFQFVTLAGFHQLNYGMFELARGYAAEGMAAYSRLQQDEFGAEANGYTATRHQREVGTGYFDQVSLAISGGRSSTVAMKESTETHQFRGGDRGRVKDKAMNMIANTFTPATGTVVDLVRQMPRTVTGFHTLIETEMDREDIRASLEGSAENSAFRLVSLEECGEGPTDGGRFLCAEFALRARRGCVGDPQIFALLREIGASHRSRLAGAGRAGAMPAPARGRRFKVEAATLWSSR